MGYVCADGWICWGSDSNGRRKDDGGIGVN